MFTSLSAQSWQYRDRRKPEVRTIPYSYRMTSRVLYSAQYHRQHCALQTFEEFGALYMTRQDSGKASVMPWSQFTKGAFPGSSRAVFGLFLVGPRPGAVHFFTPQGPRVTFNLNLKVTRDPATNKPRIKPVKYR